MTQHNDDLYIASTKRLQNTRRSTIIAGLAAVIALIFAVVLTIMASKAVDQSYIAKTQVANAQLTEDKANTRVAAANATLTPI